MNLELVRMLEEKISSALEMADEYNLADIAIKLDAALVLVRAIDHAALKPSGAPDDAGPTEGGDRERHEHG